MNVLVTGSRGFVGQHLLKHLESYGDDVVGTDRASGGPDLLDLPSLTELVATVAPDAVYHLAGQADVGGSWNTPLETFDSNARGTLNVLHACAAAGVARVLVVTSADVYGKVPTEQLPITEARSLNPGNPYAASKAAAEMVAIQANTDAMAVVRARAFNHLGPGQSTRFVAPAIAQRLIDAKAQGADSISVGNLEARRDFTDVRDVVSAYRLLVTNGVGGEAYNVCSGTDHSIGELVDMLVELAGNGIELVPDPELQRPSDTPVLCGDNTKICQATGWQPQIPLHQTLSDLMAGLAANTAAAAAIGSEAT